MGITSSWITAAVPAAQLERALLGAIPELEIVESHRGVGIEVLDDAQSRLIGVRQMLIALAFYDLGPRGVCVDPSTIWTMDERVLGHASCEVGPILGLLVATHGGCAGFNVYADGVQQRFVFYDGGTATQTGTPIPEEQGIAVDRFYWSEAEALWKAYGCGTLADYPEKLDVLVVRDRAAERG